jgi:Fe-S cluster assembly protein SufD
VNAISDVGAAGFLARYEALKFRLPGDSTLRAAAADAFRTLGLPGTTRGRPAEAWKYTTLRPMGDLSFSAGEPTFAAPAWHGSNQCLNFRAGRFLAHLSSPVPGFTRFADTPDFGELSWPDRDPMVALNTMLAEDGAVLSVPAGRDLGVVFLSQSGIDGTSAHPRHMIRLAEGARLTLIDLSSGSGCYLQNPVFEVHVADGAVLTHVRVQNDGVDAFHMATIYAAVAAGGTYDSFTLNLGGRISRTEMHARLDGPGAVAHLNAAQLLRGSQHADFTTVVRHAAPKGTSRQTVRNVLDGRSRGVFQGRIEVARGAQGTDGYQMNRALLLSPDAEVDTKPELEIFADDVKCSHGATVGELDAEQLFYLRSRGIPDSEARSILVRAFLAEALDPVTNETARDLLERHVASWWEGHAA